MARKVYVLEGRRRRDEGPWIMIGWFAGNRKNEAKARQAAVRYAWGETRIVTDWDYLLGQRRTE